MPFLTNDVWQRAERVTWPAPVAFYVAIAGAVYAKGPVGLLPFLIGGVWLWSEHGAAGLRRLTVSIDTLRADRFLALSEILEAIHRGATE